MEGSFGSWRAGRSGPYASRKLPKAPGFPGIGLASFCRCASSRTVRKGQAIISAGQPCTEVYLVYSGRVERIAGEVGHEVVVDEYLPGELFGLEALIWPCSRRSAIAAERSLIKSMPVAAFERLLRHEPDLAMTVTRMMAVRVARCNSLSHDFASGTLRERIVSALSRLAEDCGVDHETGTLINCRIRQHEIARMVGASRSRVSLALGQMLRDGHLARIDGRFVVRS